MNKFLRMIAIAAASLLAWLPASAQYPSKPVRIIVPFPAGGGADIVTRIVAQSLSQGFAQPVLVENRPGAEGAIAADIVIKSPPDGYTLFFGGTTAMVGIPIQRKNPPFDPLKAFTPISTLGQYTYYLVISSSVPAKTLLELVEYARANPGKLNYGTGNFVAFLMIGQFVKATGIQMVHVPYKGDAPIVSDLLAGHVQVSVLTGISILPQMKESRLRVLASNHRSPSTPEIPSIAEAGVPEVSVSGWGALFGPAGIPREIVDRLSRDTSAILARPDIREQLSRHAFVAQGSSSEELRGFLRDQLEVSFRAARDAGIQPE